jgi:hypothetical protein
MSPTRGTTALLLHDVGVEPRRCVKSRSAGCTSASPSNDHPVLTSTALKGAVAEIGRREQGSLCRTWARRRVGRPAYQRVAGRGPVRVARGSRPRKCWAAVAPSTWSGYTGSSNRFNALACGRSAPCAETSDRLISWWRAHYARVSASPRRLDALLFIIKTRLNLKILLLTATPCLPSRASEIVTVTCCSAAGGAGRATRLFDMQPPQNADGPS